MLLKHIINLVFKRLKKIFIRFILEEYPIHFETFSLSSKLSIEDLTAIINRTDQKGLLRFGKSNYHIEEIVGTQIKMYRKIDYRNDFQPFIIVNFTMHEEKLFLKIKLRMEYNIFIALAVLITFFFILLLNSIISHKPLKDKIILSSMMTLIYGISLLFFRYECRLIQRDLMKLFRGKRI